MLDKNHIKQGLFWAKNPSGHIWRLQEDGGPERIAYSNADHSGPICTVCGYYFCEHCEVDVPDSCAAGRAGSSLKRIHY